MLLASHKKNGKNCLTVAFVAKKNTYFTIFANFSQRWMVVYTAIMKFFEIVQDAHGCNLKSQEF